MVPSKAMTNNYKFFQCNKIKFKFYIFRTIKNTMKIKKELFFLILFWKKDIVDGVIIDGTSLVAWDSISQMTNLKNSELIIS